MNLKDHFRCPKCGCKRLEEILVNVVQVTEVSHVVDGEIDYSNYSLDGGHVDCYQCMDCEHKIATTMEGLVKAVEKMVQNE